MIEAATATNLVHLVILAGALSLDQDGTIAAHHDQIKAHLQLHEMRCDLAHQPCFAGLPGGGPVTLKHTRQATAALPSSHDADIPLTDNDADLSLQPMDNTATLSQDPQPSHCHLSNPGEPSHLWMASLVDTSWAGIYDPQSYSDLDPYAFIPYFHS
jgi:hypothetical protein